MVQSITPDRARLGRRPGRALAAIAIAAALGGSAQAAEAGRPTVDDFDRLRLAAEVAAYGHEARSPLALILAAELTATTPAEVVQRPGEGEVLGQVDLAETTVTGLLDAALALAGPDPAIEGYARRIANLESKGRMGREPRRSHHRVRGLGSVYHTLVFRGAEEAKVFVSGLDARDRVSLELRVFDPSGRGVCRAGPEATPRCEWSPSTDTTYRVEVHNPSAVARNYMLQTN